MDFFLLGAPKCGTTTLHAYLSTHPELHTGSVKEPRFFELYYDKGISHLESFVSDAKSDQLKGDCSPQYLCTPWVPALIHKHYPKAKLLIILREPVARAYSNWWMLTANGRERRSFEECVQTFLAQQETLDGSVFELKEIKKFWREYVFTEDTSTVPYVFYFDIGMYAPQLKRYQDLFSSSQILVLNFHQLAKEPEVILSQVADFLGVDSQRFEVDQLARNQSLGPTAVKVRQLAEKLGLSKLVPMSIQDRVRRTLRDWGDKPPLLDPELKQNLQKVYEPHNRELEQILGYLPWETEPSSRN